MVDVFPAPLGPRNPKASPARTSKSMPSTAVNAANRFVRRRARTRGSALDMAGHSSDAVRRRARSCRHPLLHFLDRELFFHRREVPDVAKRILEVDGPFAVELICDGSQHIGTGT